MHITHVKHESRRAGTFANRLHRLFSSLCYQLDEQLSESDCYRLRNTSSECAKYVQVISGLSLCIYIYISLGAPSFLLHTFVALSSMHILWLLRIHLYFFCVTNTSEYECEQHNSLAVDSAEMKTHKRIYRLILKTVLQTRNAIL